MGEIAKLVPSGMSSSVKSATNLRHEIFLSVVIKLSLYCSFGVLFELCRFFPLSRQDTLSLQLRQVCVLTK